MNIIRNILSSIWPDSQRTAAVPSIDSNATALPTSSRHPHYATYYDLLSTARHGTPLWLPEPNETQHINYRRRGAAIGDVVVLTDNGGLHLLFNICLDADDPINGNAVPEGFTPFKPALLASDVHRFDEYGEDSYLASKSITKKRDLQGPAGLWFESSASEGAILAMPEGAYSEDLARKSGFDRYLAENLDSWYHYVNEVREWGVEQGQLRLVTGVHKAKAWGIATFSNERTAAISDLKMVFKSNADVSSGILYSWEFEGTVDSSRSGPTRRQREAVFGGLSPLENQCLFVRTVNASSRKVEGKNFKSDSIAVQINQIDTDMRYAGLEHSGSAGPSNYSSSSRGGRFVPNQMGAQYNLSIEQSGPVLRDHPSKAINDFLLKEKPNARIAITHDEDWISLLTEDDVSLPSKDELLARLKKSCKITEQGGVVSFEFDVQVHSHSRSTSSLWTPMEEEVTPSGVVENISTQERTNTTFNAEKFRVVAGHSVGSQIDSAPLKRLFGRIGPGTRSGKRFVHRRLRAYPQEHFSNSFPQSSLDMPRAYIGDVSPIDSSPSTPDLEWEYASSSHSISDSSTSMANIWEGPMEQYLDLNPSSLKFSEMSISESDEDGFLERSRPKKENYDLSTGEADPVT